MDKAGGDLVGDWADEKAREWWDGQEDRSVLSIPSLAALLREVAVCGTERRVALHQARRVVEEASKGAYSDGPSGTVEGQLCREILSRLDKLA